MNTNEPRPHSDDKRKRRMPLMSGEETELNMTPMIDIVFQLIIFFLITLKFKTIDERIDANMPKDYGPNRTQRPPPENPKVKLKVFRKNKADEASAYTLVKIDNTHRVPLPAGPWTGRQTADAPRHRAYDTAITRVRAIVREKIAALGNDPDLFCEIVTPRPDGGAVPEGDVIRLVDALVEVGVTDIRFEGSSMPGGFLGNR